MRGKHAPPWSEVSQENSPLNRVILPHVTLLTASELAKQKDIWTWLRKQNCPGEWPRIPTSLRIEHKIVWSIYLCSEIHLPIPLSLLHPSIHLPSHPWTHSSIYLPNYSTFTNPSIHSPIHPPMHSSTHPPTYSSIHLFTYPFIHPTVHLSIHPSTCSSNPFTHPSMYSLIWHLLIHPSIQHLSVHPFIHAFIHSSCIINYESILQIITSWNTWNCITLFIQCSIFILIYNFCLFQGNVTKAVLYKGINYNNRNNNNDTIYWEFAMPQVICWVLTKLPKHYYFTKLRLHGHIMLKKQGQNGMPRPV
jgi:hypothetical protein